LEKNCDDKYFGFDYSVNILQFVILLDFLDYIYLLRMNCKLCHLKNIIK